MYSEQVNAFRGDSRPVSPWQGLFYNNGLLAVLYPAYYMTTSLYFFTDIFGIFFAIFYLIVTARKEIQGREREREDDMQQRTQPGSNLSACSKDVCPDTWCERSTRCYPSYFALNRYIVSNYC